MPSAFQESFLNERWRHHRKYLHMHFTGPHHMRKVEPFLNYEIHDALRKINLRAVGGKDLDPYCIVKLVSLNFLSVQCTGDRADDDVELADLKESPAGKSVLNKKENKYVSIHPFVFLSSFLNKNKNKYVSIHPFAFLPTLLTIGQYTTSGLIWFIENLTKLGFTPSIGAFYRPLFYIGKILLTEEPCISAEP